MNSPGEIRIEIQWQCPHCGHVHAQPAMVSTQGSGGAEPGLIGAGSMICSHCGQLGPIQLGYAIVLGMMVMASSDGALNMPWPGGRQPDQQPWAGAARRPSPN